SNSGCECSKTASQNSAAPPRMRSDPLAMRSPTSARVIAPSGKTCSTRSSSDMNRSFAFRLIRRAIIYTPRNHRFPAAATTKRRRISSAAFSRSEEGPLLRLVKLEREAVHAPALPAGFARTVVEQVPEMRAAASAAHLGAHHTVRAVLVKRHRVRRDGFGEARPAGAGVVLRRAVEQRVP